MRFIEVGEKADLRRENDILRAMVKSMSEDLAEAFGRPVPYMIGLHKERAEQRCERKRQN